MRFTHCCFVAMSAFALATSMSSRFTYSQLRPASTYMPVADIRPGMTGYGLTVFHGTTPERFEVEVIDVLHGFRPQQDLILIRTRHPILERANAVGGMSGSPIYIEGRLIGAYAYGWPFGSEPVVGVTPIHNMLRDLGRNERNALSQVLAPARTHTLRARPSIALAAMPEHGFVPASTPLLTAGLPQEALNYLSSELSEYGLEFLQAGGTGTNAQTSTPHFVDGGAVGVTLVRGDISMQAIGTVTHVAGDRAVAFGHPMLESGETMLPTSIARVLHVVSSVQRSFKLAEAVAYVGALVQDRQASVVVDERAHPTLIPVRITLSGPQLASDSIREWNLEIANHHMLTPLLLATAVVAAVKSTASDMTDVTFSAQSSLWLEGVSTPMIFEDRGFSQTGVFQQSALSQLRVFPALEATYGNAFREARASRIEIELALNFAHNTAEIVSVATDTSTVRAGDDVTIRVTLRRFGQPDEIRVTSVSVPSEVRGHLQVLIQPGNEVEIERTEARSLEDIFANIRRGYLASSMVLSARLPSRGVRVGNHVVRSLPPSMYDAFQADADSDAARPIQTVARRELRTDYILNGSARLELEVQAPRS